MPSKSRESKLLKHVRVKAYIAARIQRPDGQLDMSWTIVQA